MGRPVGARKCQECGGVHLPDMCPEGRGLPLDCPGCLGRGTIEERPYGKRAGDYTLTCRECGTVYHWSER